MMNFVGIDISEHAVRFVEFVSTPKHLKLGRFGERTLPEGTILSGEIKDPGTLKTALIGLRREHNLSFVRASLPEEKAFLFRKEIPNYISSEEIRENIAFQLEEYVPIKVMDAEFDYSLAEPLFDKATPGTREVVVSVFPKSTVESYLDAYLSAGLTPLSFEMEGSSLQRALIESGDMGTYMIADMGRLRTSLAIVSKGAVHFTSTIEVGGEVITEAIEKSLSVSRDEAEKLKIEGAFSHHGKYRELFPALIESSRTLTDQIKKHYVYWHNHPDKKDSSPPAIEKVILCGGDANLEGLAEHLALSLRTFVVVGNVWTNAFSTDNYIPPLSRAESLSYASAIGLALREI
ncbi:MAG: pilus assembly protein PilM [Patescibacteria group bacterium]